MEDTNANGGTYEVFTVNANTNKEISSHVKSNVNFPQVQAIPQHNNKLNETISMNDKCSGKKTIT